MTDRRKLTLALFEKLDGALDFALRADDANAARAESRLYDVLIDLEGYDVASEIPSLTGYAAERVTSCLAAA